MPQFIYSAGFNNVGSYQTSAEPWTSSSLVVPALGQTPLEVAFPQVTKFVTVRSDSEIIIRVGFSSGGVAGVVNNNYFTLDESGSFSSDYRVTSVFLVSDKVGDVGAATVIAGLTGIKSGHLADNWSGSSGIG